MTSISANSTTSAGASQSAGKVGVRRVLRDEVADGTLSETDFSAISSALKNIRSARSDAGSTSGDTKKPRFDDLVAEQVQAGNLTSDQAQELLDAKATAKAASSDGQTGVAATGGGHRHRHAQDATASSTTSSTSTGDAAATMQQFVAALQNAGSATAAYDQSGSNAASTAAGVPSALLIDTVA